MARGSLSKSAIVTPLSCATTKASGRTSTTFTRCSTEPSLSLKSSPNAADPASSRARQRMKKADGPMIVATIGPTRSEIVHSATIFDPVEPCNHGVHGGGPFGVHVRQYDRESAPQVRIIQDAGN